MKELLIECPACQKEVNVDSPNVQKAEDGLELIVECPFCKEQFKIQRVKWVRQMLNAKYAIIRDETGQKQRIKITQD